MELTVKGLCKLFYTQLGIQLEWKGEAEKETGIVKSINKDVPLFWKDSKRHPDVFDRINISDFHDSSFPSVSVGGTVIAIDPTITVP